MNAIAKRPTWRKWKRKLGGQKICPACGHAHAPTAWDGQAVRRSKICKQCGAALPANLTYPARAHVRWYVREGDAAAGKTRDFACHSSEAADELIGRLRRDWTPDFIQQRLLEQASVLIRGIQQADYEAGVDDLIVALGGDPKRRRLQAIGLDEARQQLGRELREKGLAVEYVADVERNLRFFTAAAGVTRWADVDAAAIDRYRSARLAGGWILDGKCMSAVGPRGFNKSVRTLSAAFARFVVKNWLLVNPLTARRGNFIKVPRVRVEYVPDEDLAKILAAAEPFWLKVFIGLAYYTGARRGDLLTLTWKQVDLEGAAVRHLGRSGPHVFIRGVKSDTPRWTPIHPALLLDLQRLRLAAGNEERVFPALHPSRISEGFAKVCQRAGVTRTVQADGGAAREVNRWSLHDLRRKANTDLRNGGASPKERAALLGHRSVEVNELHYEALLPGRERQLIDALPYFGPGGAE